MLIRVGYEIAVEVTSPTAVYAYLNVHPQHEKDIVWACSEQIAGTRHIDIHGNAFVRQTLPEGETVLTHDAIVEVSGLPDIFDDNAAQVDPAHLPTECLPYLLGSRYCETDRMSQIAWSRFGHYQGGAERVRAICDFVNAHLSFSYGYARSTRTALEAYNERVGVCRDFAHLVITLCRALNIPARYANGFMGDIGVSADPSPMDYNAWVEVYLDGQWFTVDARHNQPRIGRILVARGRDASDIPLFSTFGPHRLNRFEVWTEEYKGLQAMLSHGERVRQRGSSAMLKASDGVYAFALHFVPDQPRWPCCCSLCAKPLLSLLRLFGGGPETAFADIATPLARQGI